jgi:hypothetical protein
MALLDTVWAALGAKEFVTYAPNTATTDSLMPWAAVYNLYPW